MTGRPSLPFALSVIAVVSALGLVACTSSAPPAPISSTVTQTETLTRPASVIPTAPVVAGPTTSAVGTCPFIAQATVMPILGQRLDHASVQTSGGKPIGCEFFPIYTGALAQSEHLPAPPYPSLKFVVTTYQSPDSAHNALARQAGAGGNPSQTTVGGKYVGETYQTTFYPPDGKLDWACAFIVGSRIVTVLTANTDQEATTQDLADAIAATV